MNNRRKASWSSDDANKLLKISMYISASSKLTPIVLGIVFLSSLFMINDKSVCSAKTQFETV